MIHRKSSSQKVLAVGDPEGPQAGFSRPNEQHTENVEAIIPMISHNFRDAKVRQTKSVMMVLLVSEM